MAGNVGRRGATRKPGSKKGPLVGSGGQRRKGLEGRGPTPKAADRPNHKTYKAAHEGGAAGSGAARRAPPRRSTKTSREIVAGRNSVLEALRTEPDPEPDDLEALDAAWEEEEVLFGPGAAADCGKDGLTSRMRAARRPAEGIAVPPPQRPVVTHSANSSRK